MAARRLVVARTLRVVGRWSGVARIF